MVSPKNYKNCNSSYNLLENTNYYLDYDQNICTKLTFYNKLYYAGTYILTQQKKSRPEEKFLICRFEMFFAKAPSQYTGTFRLSNLKIYTLWINLL